MSCKGSSPFPFPGGVQHSPEESSYFLYFIVVVCSPRQMREHERCSKQPSGNSGGAAVLPVLQVLLCFYVTLSPDGEELQWMADKPQKQKKKTLQRCVTVDRCSVTQEQNNYRYLHQIKLQKDHQQLSELENLPLLLPSFQEIKRNCKDFRC